jgi:DNA-binding response OmpR family regulator
VKTAVLIAEADPQLCGSYERMFAGSGLRIETAADGLDCWTKLRAGSPDALMVDVGLLWGGSDGVLARLREDSDAAVNPEIFVTGDDSPEVLSRRAGIEVGRCFQKPLEMGTVLNSICDVFAS